MLKIGNYIFEETWVRRGSSLMFFEADEEYGEAAQWSVDIAFEHGDYNGEKISPSISINPIDTEKTSVEELVGEEFAIDDVEMCDEREDTFYIFEQEPMCNYRISIVELDGDKARVTGSGQLIVDGYATPYTVDNFEFDCWIPVILSATDWNKFENSTPI